MQPVAIMFDFDGTLFDTMGRYTALGSEVMARRFGISRKKAAKLFLANSGIPFPNMLKKIFPQGEASKIEACAKEYGQRKLKYVYGNARPFRDVEPALQALKSGDFSMFISSSTETSIIEPLLKKYGLRKYFSGVLGLKEGPKKEHIKFVLGKKGFEKVCFVGDSKSDAGLRKRFASGTVFTIGRAGKRAYGLQKKRTLLRSGATFATSDLRSIATIDFGKAMQKSIEGKLYRRTPARVFQQIRMRLKRL